MGPLTKSSIQHIVSKQGDRESASRSAYPRVRRLKVTITEYWHRLLCRSSPKNQLLQNRFRKLERISYLLIPVSFTLVTLSLNWRRQYLTSSGANQTLALLQIAAKVHDVFITLSLTDVLLYHLRRQLISRSGTSYGVFGVAYSVGFGALPFSSAFWRPVLSNLAHRGAQWRNRALVCLVLVTVIIGLAGNPAASIVLVPRLDWWPSQDYFSFVNSKGQVSSLSQAGFRMYVPRNIFPTVVDSSSLRVNTTIMGNSLPEQDATNLQLWARNSLSVYPLTRGAEMSLSFLNTSLRYDPARQIIASGFGRRDDSHSNDYNCSAYRMDTLITNHLLAQYLNMSIAVMAQSRITQPVGTAGGPWTLQVHLPDDILKVPRVNVICEVQPATLPSRNLSIIFGDDHNFNPFLNNVVNVDAIWDDTLRTNSEKTLFERLELPQMENMMVGAILMPSNSLGSANISLCVVRGVWSFTSMWTMPSQNVPTTSSNFTYSFPVLGPEILKYSEPGDPDFFPLHNINNLIIRKSWADSLNQPSPNSSLTLLADLMDQNLYPGLRNTEDGGDFGTWDWCWPTEPQSIILSAVIADGLGRIGNEYSLDGAVICRDRWCSMGSPMMDIHGNPVMFNGTYGEFSQLQSARPFSPDNSRYLGSQQVLYSFPQPKDFRMKWTEISLKINRYGYGWGFNTKLVKAAAAILILHAVIILAHCCYMLISGRYYCFAGSVSDIVALALKSNPPEGLDLTSRESRKTFDARTTAVRRVRGSRQYEQQLEIVIDPDCNEGTELLVDHTVMPYEGA